MSPKIDVNVTDDGGGWTAHVTIDEDGSKTMHRVTVPRAAYERLTSGKASADELLRASFEFLLEREPKESILREFDIMTIQRYFPEYEREMRRQFAAGR